MRFNNHFEVAGKHAILSASKGSWINYSDEKLARVFESTSAAQRGTELHDLADRLVKLGVRLPDLPSTLNMYVNDVIGFRMKTEVVLFYSLHCFGTADAIGFNNGLLRIFDLKMGLTIAGERQVVIYAAFFCLEYGFKPHDLTYDLRVYQNNEFREVLVDPDDILHIMNTCIRFDKMLDRLREEAS